QLFDHREVVGAPVWMKPAKFGASIALTAPVLAWIIGLMRESPRRRRLEKAGNVMAGVFALELTIILVQVGRGGPSAFNNATTLDMALFNVMGTAISVFWVAELIIARAAFQHRFGSATRTWAIRLGLAGTLLGGILGFAMSPPSRAQIQELKAG